MHFYEGKNGTQFNYNSDMSGKVKIHIERPMGGTDYVEVNGKDLVQFVMEYLRRETISRLEHMSHEELLSSLIFDPNSGDRSGRKARS